ncbi:hypothetical protein [Candidatus Poriferisodalis sp.]|uniref:hypothetical protein n=1 Tax=Candidatus Poriferisodalis sp. TaxID=3101277 RepID=UPI003B028DF1
MATRAEAASQPPGSDIAGTRGPNSVGAGTGLATAEIEVRSGPPNALWRYVPTLRNEDDHWRLRIVAHDFGMVWEETDLAQRLSLVETEPAPFDQRWDAFLAAYVEHRCSEDGLVPPPWVMQPERHLRTFWHPCGCPDWDLVRSIVTTPGAFELHGIWLPRDELLVV